MSRGLGRFTKALIEHAAAILKEIQPATVRAVCYRLFVARLIASMEKNETNKVSRALVTGREQGLIPWAWIVDETRAPEQPGTWQNPDTIIEAAVRGYRRDRWQDQSEWVEVWSEKGTVRGTLGPVLREYGVTFRVTHGYGSATLVNDVAEATAARGQKLTVLYVGDFDPSGMHMSEVDLPARLDEYGAHVDLVRVALTSGDVADLPPRSLAEKRSDPRSPWFLANYGDLWWELDGMPPPLLRARVEREIRARLDLDAWEHAAEIEAVEVQSMQAFHRSWLESKSGPA